MNHELKEVNYDTMTAVCVVCGPTKIRFKGKYGRVCVTKVNENNAKRYHTPDHREYMRAYMRTRSLVKKQQTSYRKHVKMTCEKCGWTVPNPVLMDCHHKDFDKKNNDPSNIQSLCAVCHRIVHYAPDIPMDLIVRTSSKPSIHANPSPVIDQRGYEDALAEISGLKLDLKRISDQAIDESTALGIARDEIAELKRKVEACARATDNQKAQWCIREYEKIKAWAAKQGNEFTQ